VVAIYVIGVALLGLNLAPESGASSPTQFIVAVTVWTFLFVITAYRAGETPRWQRGGTDGKDNFN